jgi:hypothetical protein
VTRSPEEQEHRHKLDNVKDVVVVERLVSPKMRGLNA